MKRPMSDQQRTDLSAERVIKINRVSKVVKGGRRFSFNTLAVVGNLQGKVGVGLGKANEVPDAIRKAMEAARANLETVPLTRRKTIPHDIEGRFKATRVLLRPATAGTGVIAGESVKAVLETAGVHDVLSKVIGSKNPLNVVRATIDALKQLETPLHSTRKRGIPLSHLFGKMDI